MRLNGAGVGGVPWAQPCTCKAGAVPLRAPCLRGHRAAAHSQRYERVPLSLPPQVLPRMLNAEYTFPPDVPISDSCKDLIRSILVDHTRRLDLEGIKRHPWFLT